MFHLFGPMVQWLNGDQPLVSFRLPPLGALRTSLNKPGHLSNPSEQCSTVLQPEELRIALSAPLPKPSTRGKVRRIRLIWTPCMSSVTFGCVVLPLRAANACCYSASCCIRCIPSPSAPSNPAHLTHPDIAQCELECRRRCLLSQPSRRWPRAQKFYMNKDVKSSNRSLSSPTLRSLPPFPPLALSLLPSPPPDCHQASGRVATKQAVHHFGAMCAEVMGVGNRIQ